MDVYNPGLRVDQIPRKFKEVYEGMVEGTVSVRTLHSGRVYKFADSAVPYPEKLSSPWWWPQRSFDSIRKSFRIDPSNPGEIVRMMGGIKYEWSKLDQLIVADVGSPIKVFVGPGRMQSGDKSVKADVLYTPPASLMQMYIPGLRTTGTKLLSEMGFAVIKNPIFIPLASRDDLGITSARFRSGTMVLIPGDINVH